MKRFVFSALFILLSFDALGARPEKRKPHASPLQLARSFIGEKISKIEPGKTSVQELKKILGEPQLIEDQVYYYDINGRKYDLSIAISKEKVESFVYDLPNNVEKNPDQEARFGV